MIEVLFFEGLGLISRLIQWQTRSHVSHVALRMDGEVIEAWHVPFPRGRVYHHANMAECMAIHDPLTRIDVFHVRTMTTETERLVRTGAWRFAKSLVGKPYDLRMVIRFLPRMGEAKGTRARWFCSELVASAFEVGGLPILRRIKPCYVSPRDLYVSPNLSYSHAEVWNPFANEMDRTVDIHRGGIV